MKIKQKTEKRGKIEKKGKIDRGEQMIMKMKRKEIKQGEKRIRRE